MNKKVILGEEYDEVLLARIRNVLAEQHAMLFDKTWALVGAQEVCNWEVLFRNQGLTIEAETYMGLSIIGPSELVEEIAATIVEQNAL